MAETNQPVIAIVKTLETTPGTSSTGIILFDIQKPTGKPIIPPRIDPVNKAGILGPYTSIIAGGIPTTVINVGSQVYCPPEKNLV